MAKVLIFSNLLGEGQRAFLEPTEPSIADHPHNWTSVGPGMWATRVTGKKHMQLWEIVKRVVACLIVFIKWRKYDVLACNSSVTGFLLALFSMAGKGKRKLIITNFNLPRRRRGWCRWIAEIAYRRVDHFFVHSTNDTHLAAEVYHLPAAKFSFWPYVRETPASGEPSPAYMFESKEEYIVSYGCNARDYRTFVRAVETTQLRAVVVAREYNLRNIIIPPNVLAFCDIPLEQCDKLVSQCRFAVFTFDGSEPSCGQISIVTAFMLGKPVICTECPGVREYVRDGENGLLVKMNDADDLQAKMVRLTEDDGLYVHLAEGARRWAEEHAVPARIHRRFSDVITQITSG